MAGSRGFGIFAARYPDGNSTLVLQHRALDPDGTPPAYASSRLSLVSDMIIIHCPWCGENLKNFYQNSIDALDRTDLKIL